MKRTLLLFALLFAGQSATAEECAELGVENAFLLKLFCSEIETILEGGTATRSMSDTTSTTDEADLDFDWAGIGILRDAYRADPATTLDLIARIRNSGGLSDLDGVLNN